MSQLHIYTHVCIHVHFLMSFPLWFTGACISSSSAEYLRSQMLKPCFVPVPAMPLVSCGSVTPQVSRLGKGQVISTYLQHCKN